MLFSLTTGSYDIQYRCPGKPALEITTIANIKAETGEVELPTDATSVPRSILLEKTRNNSTTAYGAKSKAKSGRKSHGMKTILTFRLDDSAKRWDSSRVKTKPLCSSKVPCTRWGYRIRVGADVVRTCLRSACMTFQL